MMFLQYFVWGGWAVTIGNYMSTIGFADSISWAYSVGPIAAIIAPFIVGMVADRFFPTERVLGLMHMVSGAALVAVPFMAPVGSSAFLGMLFVHTLFYMPTLGLSNSMAFHHLVDRDKSFPVIRVFGTIGWIAAGFVVSKLLKADSSPIPLYVTGGTGILLGLYSLTLPHTPPPDKGKAISVRDVLCLDALSMLKRPSFTIFLICSMLVCIPLAIYFAYVPVYLSELQIADPGFKMSFGQMSEVVFMLMIPFFLRRLKIKTMLLIGVLAWVVRYGLFALGAPDVVFWMIMGGILLHGICYDFFFVTGQIYVDRQAPPAIRSQAQGFLVLMTYGLGMFIGAQIAGVIHTTTFTEGVDIRQGWQDYWIIPTVIAAGVMVFLFLFFKEETPPKVHEETDLSDVKPQPEAGA